MSWGHLNRNHSTEMACPGCLVVVLLLCMCYQPTFAIPKKNANILLFLTDDQDMQGLVPMSNTLELLAVKGSSFSNSFVNTPLCCPSRSTLLTGLYQHNTHVWNNSLSGNCSSILWQHWHEPHTFAHSLHKAGYRTFFAGKYLNQYGSNHSGGVQHVPAGWDWWAGLKGNSRYYNYTLSINGTAEHFKNRYLTDHIRDLAVDFLRAQPRRGGPPFLMVLSPPAPHAPFTAAPRHEGCYPNATVPRTPNFNPPQQKDKHWLVRQPPWPLPEEVVSRIDESWRRRWCTLLAVDEMVAGVVRALRRMSRLSDTYVIFTSDNGFHLGHYGLPWDKRQPYDTDVRVPLLVRGPGVRRGRALRSAVMTADLAPTILDMAGLPPSPRMDGRSFLPQLRKRSGRKQLRAILVEHSGEGGTHMSSECPGAADRSLYNCVKEAACKCQDAANNTYSCVRLIGPHRDFSFCKFHDNEEFIEAYDLRKDPYQMANLAPQMRKSRIKSNEKLLKQLKSCFGASCIDDVQ